LAIFGYLSLVLKRKILISRKKIRKVKHTWKRRGSYVTLVGKPEVKGPRGRSRCRWEDNIKMDLQKVGCGGHGLD